jgi:hypothetical protein
MTVPVPKIDDRTEKQIAEQARVLLKHYTCSTFVPEPGRNEALVHVFARFADIIIQRLNRVPEKQLLAFLDLLGNSRLPPQPARAPLTFTLAAGSSVDAVVPAGTQVAAAPAEGEAEPVIFETERELVVTAAQLTSLFVRDPLRDRYADRGAILTEADPSGVAPFQGDVQIEHMLYIGHRELLEQPHINEVLLTLTLEKALGDVVWEMWNGDAWQTVANPTGTEENQIKLSPIAPIPISRVNGLDNRWLRCRLLTPITPATDPEQATIDRVVLASQLASIRKVQMKVTVEGKDLPIEAAFANLLPADPNKAFYPFGEKPALGDTLYLASSAAFSQAGAKVSLYIDLIGGAGNPKLKWEFWAGEAWHDLELLPREDPSQAFTASGAGTIEFTFPQQPVATTVNGVENYWIRVRIVAGDYGKEAEYALKGPQLLGSIGPAEEFVDDLNKSDLDYISGDLCNKLNEASEIKPPLSKRVIPIKEKEADSWLLFDTDTVQTYLIKLEDSELKVYDTQPAGYQLTPASFAPPLIRSVKVNEFHWQKEAPPEAVLTYNNHEYQHVPMVNDDGDTSFAPFQPTKDEVPTLYLGFTPPPDRPALLNSTLNLFFQVADVLYDPSQRPGSPPSPSHLRWEYWNGQTWEALTVRDDANNLTRSGLVEFLAPPDFAPRREFGVTHHWLRVLCEPGEDVLEPRLQGVWLNTTMAAQAVTIRDEILGASDGSPKQAFHATHTPILKGPGHEPQLEVQEPAAPGSPPAAAEQVQSTWVPWSEVPDFYASGADDRRYVLDHLSGEIRFGDGVHGRIPPPGGSIRLARYRTGGGAAGNRPAGTITQLKTSVPYVEGVTNWAAAAGGAGAETIEALYARAPRTLRHGGRAVTRQDYEDLARLASPEVARAQCVPLQSQSPFDTTRAPGAVSVVIVPRSTEARPLPGSELVRRVQEYLQAHSAPTVEIHVVGPLYLRVKVSVEIIPTSLEAARAVEQAVARELAGFLHPLTGGKEGTGWAFGRLPERSELYAQLGAVPGVDHIRSLEIEAEADNKAATDAIRRTGRFLIYSGRHSITVRSDDASAAT